MAGESILIVDDNPMNRKLVRVVLESEGYEICTAAQAREVLAVLQEFRPRLILMDIQLPGIDGLELTGRLKAATATRSIPIIGLTAHAMKGDEERILAAAAMGTFLNRSIPAPCRYLSETAWNGSTLTASRREHDRRAQASDLLQKDFEPRLDKFFQVDSSESRGYGGMGMGYISRSALPTY